MRTSQALTIAAALMLAAAIFPPAALAQSAAQDPHLTKAMELRGQALSAYANGDYDASAELARQAKAELALMRPRAQAPKAPQEAAPLAAEEPALAPLPASYTVRLIPGDRDCLSKIAGYPFVYGDRNKWPMLYRANRGTLRHPENADLILPAEILVIPSIAGEAREGEYDPGRSYPAFPAR